VVTADLAGSSPPVSIGVFPTLEQANVALDAFYAAPANASPQGGE
jgi:hypothetical protein